MNNEYKYDAFISYRHLEPDKSAASKLQKLLESYNPPKSVMPKKFSKWRIFRDETELSSSSNLSTEIKSALEKSKFLIVVCSEKTKLSRWCMEEISYFKQLHNGSNSNIIPIVVDGKPEDVFPDELCTELIPVTDEAGNVSYHSKSVEPMAANVAAPSQNKILKKLRSEFLRIAAPILGCDYDELYNRAQKRKYRRIMAIGTLIAIFVFLFGMYSSAMLYEINNQKMLLEDANLDLQAKTEELDLSNKELQESNSALEIQTAEANDQRGKAEKNYLEAESQRKKAEENLAEATRQKKLAEKNLAEANRQKAIAQSNLAEANKQKEIAVKNLAEANRQKAIAVKNENEANNQRAVAEQNMLVAQENEARANRQTQLALKENSRNLATLSENQWNSGDTLSAIQTALSALPDEGNNRPVVAEVLRVLSKETGAFKSTNFSAVKKLSTDTPVLQTGFAGGGASVVALDSEGVYFWDAATGEMKKKHPGASLTNHAEDGKIYFDDNGMYKTLNIYSYSNGLYMHNEHKYIEGYAKTGAEEKPLFREDLLIKYPDGVHKLSGATGEILWSISDESSTGNNVNINDTKIFVSHRIYNEEDKCVAMLVKTYNRNTGELVADYELTDADMLSAGYCEWLEIANGKAWCKQYSVASESYELFMLDIRENRMTNKKRLHVFDKYGLCENFQSSHTDAVKVTANSTYIVKTHWNNPGYSYTTEYIALDSEGNTKWTYSDKNVDYNINGHIRIDEFDAKMCDNYCDIVAITKDDYCMLLNSATGEPVHKFGLDSIIQTAYATQNGVVTAITSQGYEVALLARGIKENADTEQTCFMIQLHKFMNQHNKYSYCNNRYAVVNTNSCEIYLYADTQNEDYEKIFSPQRGIGNISVNSSNTYMLIDMYDKKYLCNIHSKEVSELPISGEQVYEMFFVSDGIVGVTERKANALHMYDILTGNKIFSVSPENDSLKSIKVNNSSKIASATGGNLIFADTSDNLTIVNQSLESVTWSPERSNPVTQKSEKGVVREVYHTGTSPEILCNVKYYSAPENSGLVIYNTNTHTTVLLEPIPKSGNATEPGISSVEWLDSDKVAIAFSDNTVRCFNTLSGKCLSEFSITNGAVVSLVYLGNSSQIGILCKNSVLYKANPDTGEIYSEVSLGNESIKSSDSDKAITCVDKNKNLLILSGWNVEFGLNRAYVIDLESFNVIYDIDGYISYIPESNSVLVENYNEIGSYPLYTAEKLARKGRTHIGEH